MLSPSRLTADSSADKADIKDTIRSKGEICLAFILTSYLRSFFTTLSDYLRSAPLPSEWGLYRHFVALIPHIMTAIFFVAVAWFSFLQQVGLI